MPRPYNKSNPIVQRMLAANEARKLGKRRGSTVAACRDSIIQVIFNIEILLLLWVAACRDRTTKATQ